ncbi:MAG TPA: MraY family glycosyltransferase [Candidatus Dormibacteraeota bacterium]|nr:MraY family glycosyltransferase [Candidatus Dormibacteraeota bacterium]
MVAASVPPTPSPEDFFSIQSLIAIRDHLLPGFVAMLFAFAICAVVVPLMILLSRRLGLIAQPSERHPHSRPMPLLGGLAMFIGFTAAMLLFLRQVSGAERKGVLGVLFVSGLAAVLLIADDRWSLPPLTKLGLQLLIALIAVIGLGALTGQPKEFQITFVSLPGAGIIQLGLLSVPISLFWLLGMQNTVNLLDGVDGLAAGVVMIVAITLMFAGAGTRQPDVVMLSGALAGTCAGFLLFNFSPARIFMGDSGAHFLGTALGVISIVGVAKVAVAFALVIPVLALALPIADTAWAIVRRGMTKASVAQPDLKHIHHRLLDFGLNARQTCFVFYSASGLLGAVGLTIFGHKRVVAVVVVAWLVLVSTLAADRLQKADWRFDSPLMRRLLAEPGSR